MLVEVLIYLSVAVICVGLASWSRLGAVLGYLVAGIVVGPWGFAWIQDSTHVLHISELGIVLMLFLIGLELDPKRLWQMRGQVFLGGSGQLLLCALALTAAVWPLLPDWRSALIAGCALALSSTAVAMQAMTERNLLTTPMGRSGFAILLFQDIAAIPLLALVAALAPTTSAPVSSAWLATGKAIAAILIVIVLGSFLIRPLLRLVARTHLRELFTATALLLVLGVAALMAAAGLSMALGAFLAGVLLASSEYRHALETDLEPFKGLLLGLFFVAVGMTMDFALLLSRPIIVAGLLLGLLFIKFLLLWWLAKRLDITAAHRPWFAVLLSQGSEFAFVIFTLAQQQQVLSSNWAGALSLTVALSMASTPLLLMAVARWQRARPSQRAADTIEPPADATVIIAGFGRFGQVIGRLLFASGIKAVVLDHDPDQIQFLRKFGFTVHYGDATRLDLLQAAGADRARLLINAIDDVNDNLALVDKVRAHFPQLAILARARNVSHYYELRQRGVEVLERETFESALRLGRRALEQLGHDAHHARELADRFRRHNLQTLTALQRHLTDEASRLSLAKAARTELEAQFERDRQQLVRAHGEIWTAAVSRAPESESGKAESVVRPTATE
ncbi:glutathione-regulated potassium-efflux system protein KefC [Permianibacter sp. IMCC34836]|uniref:glutathione-regulated potassium-efflux system protein KefC n=1 Tax=Permianibacter fluminis TaxID=2738515 RepID=UPI001555B3A4|nr:glutathione-regulated potassium-efflux system protein KefC [Permianibacter fluminis]NQD36715.1 glutathione-regulated potassium-efflux system protein KefC [Permianibacter fluminis]